MSELDNASAPKVSEMKVGVSTPEAQAQSLNIDWQKVGRIYKPESAIEEIVAREMKRLHKVLDVSVEL